MAATAPTASDPKLDIEDAFGWTFRSKGWFGKLLILGICLVFSFLIVPAFIYYGYMAAASRTVREGGRELPPWSDVGEKLVDGLKLVAVIFVWALPCTIPYFIGILLVSGCSSDASASTCVNPGALLLIGIAALLFIVLFFLSPAIWAQYLDGGFGAAFNVGGVFKRAGRRPGLTVVVPLLTLVAGIVGELGIILLLIGLLITLPYALMIQANLFGQYTRLTGSPAVTMGTPPATAL